MKKNSRNAKEAATACIGVACAFLGVLLGWSLNGLNQLTSYLSACPIQALVWGVVGFLVGVFMGRVLSRLDEIGKRGRGSDGDKTVSD